MSAIVVATLLAASAQAVHSWDADRAVSMDVDAKGALRMEDAERLMRKDDRDTSRQAAAELVDLAALPATLPVVNVSDIDGIVNVSRINGLQSNTSMTDVMHVKFDGNGDTLELASSVVFSAGLICYTLVVFKVLSSWYPSMFSQRHFELESTLHAQEHPDAHGLAAAIDDVTSLWRMMKQAMSIDERRVIETAGLDVCMHLEFELLALKIIACLCVVTIVACPFHWFGSSGGEYVARLRLNVDEDRYHVLWMHAALVWYVVAITTQQLCGAQEKFLPMRYEWLRRMGNDQATTVLVEGLPDSLRSDSRLRTYFSGLFPEGVMRSYVVRNTTALQSKLARREQAQRRLDRTLRRVNEEVQWQVLQAQHLREAVANTEEEVGFEQMRVGRAAETFDPDVCTESGFVTFRTRRDAHVASRVQLADDSLSLSVQAAPAPDDIIYENLLHRPSNARRRAGWLSIAIVFVAFTPLVVFISGIMSLRFWQQLFPVIATWRQKVPVIAEMLEGSLATLGLKLLLALLPSIFLEVVHVFFKPVSKARVQLIIQGIYFDFLVVFVLLVTAFAQGLISTLLFVAQQPTAVLPLLAKSLPLASHFYVNYLLLGAVACTFELLRLYPLIKYLGLREFHTEEEARIRAEDDMIWVGPRVSKSVMMLVIAVVFCSICPFIQFFAAVYFVMERVSHSYLCCVAEPRQPDLGGAFWVQAVKQVHVGLLIYVLLMIGILGASGLVFVVALVPNLFIVAWSWMAMDKDFLWERLPFEYAMEVDEKRSSGQESTPRERNIYIQKECEDLDDAFHRAQRYSNRGPTTQDTDPTD